MASRAKTNGDETTFYLKYLVALELYRAGLSQAEIRKRLGLNNNLVNDMLKGLPRQKSTTP